MSTRSKKIKVLMAGVEVRPFAKVGGLADVMGSLPPALKKLGVDIRLIMPLYSSIDRKKYGLKRIYSDLEIPSGRIMIKVDIHVATLPGTRVKIYFIEAPEYFAPPEVYVPGDNSERFLFFSLAALYCLPVLDFEPQIIHCQDSHVALIPDIIKVTNLEYLKELKTLYTIHNFRYQGKTKEKVLSTGNLSKESTKTLSKDAQDGDINFMVQGVLQADLINTVSPSYSREITTSHYGAGLDNIIRKRKKDLYGILNGIDLEFFSPSKNPAIKHRYNRRTISNKVKNKIFLQKKLGLEVNEDIPLIGMITRLAWQKGVDLITDRFSRLKAQFVFLGTGTKKYEDHLKRLAKNNPNQFSAQILFDSGLAQQIYAGSDMFLMPSRYEPCGLGQMIAMRYGTLPIVRETGGLKDTVKNFKLSVFNIQKGKLIDETGFSFKDVSVPALLNTIKNALDIYYEYPNIWKQLQINAMSKDFSWDRSAQEYLDLYRKLV
jgi:starch synthase